MTDDAKQDKKADFTVNMKEPIPDKDLPTVGSDETTLIGTFDSYTQTPPMIILRDGDLQIEHKKAPVHKPSAYPQEACCLGEAGLRKGHPRLGCLFCFGVGWGLVSTG